ncbi:peroxiredoxin family protein [Taibaiella helva]|uniref:peroxiredoxin family protein n=1 Tax=Taibaiella helva TaxID=2301235 RepID=UPI000E5742C0|nr:redoxin domain-containing protein [Taibaiella helva]
MIRKYILPLLWLCLFIGSDVSAQQKRMPDLRFKDTEEAAVSTKDIPKGQPLMLLYFRSDCDHCEHTAQQLKGTAKQYPAAIWMVSAEPIPTLRTFEDMMGLYDISNLRVMQDHTQSMHRWFEFTKLPFIVLYDQNGLQKAVFDELPTVAAVKKALANRQESKSR